MRVILALNPPSRPIDDETIWLGAKSYTVSRGDITIQFRRRVFQVASAIIASKLVSLDDLMAHLYEDDENGGPESNSIISVYLYQARRQLVVLGIGFRNEWSQGWRLVSRPFPRTFARVA